MRTTFVIVRDEIRPDVIRGKFYYGSRYICETLELPWKDNQRQISCIPNGVYHVKHRHSQRFSHHLHLYDVENREFILIHPGNTTSDIRGCIVPGTRRGTLSGMPAVLESKKAQEKIMNIASNYEEMQLWILSVPPIL